MHVGSDGDNAREGSIEQMYGEAMYSFGVKRTNEGQEGDIEAHATHGGRYAAAEAVQRRDDLPESPELVRSRSACLGEACYCNRRHRLRRKTTFCCR